MSKPVNVQKNKLIVDLDGTLADIEHRRPYLRCKPKNWDAFFEAIPRDKVNENVHSIMQHFSQLGWQIVLLSGRRSSCLHATKAWLESNDIKYDKLLLRQANDFRPDAEIKSELDDSLGEGRRLIIDDRNSVVDMWRSKGYECWQVAPGDF